MPYKNKKEIEIENILIIINRNVLLFYNNIVLFLNAKIGFRFQFYHKRMFNEINYQI